MPKPAEIGIAIAHQSILLVHCVRHSDGMPSHATPTDISSRASIRGAGRTGHPRAHQRRDGGKGCDDTGLYRGIADGSCSHCGMTTMLAK